eukprot:g13628.t1
MRVFFCWPPAMVLGIMRNGGHPQLRTLRDAEAELPDENEGRDAGMEQPRLGVGRLRKRHTTMEESTTWAENTVRGPGRDESGVHDLSDLLGPLFKELKKAVQAPSEAPQLPKELPKVPKTVQPHEAVQAPKTVQPHEPVLPHGAELLRDHTGRVRGALDDRNTNMTSRAAGRTAAQLNAGAAVGFGLLRPSISEDGRRLLLSPNRLPDGMGNYVSARVSFLGCQLRIEWGRGPRHPEDPEDPRISGGSAEMLYRITVMECQPGADSSAIVARWWYVLEEPPTAWEVAGLAEPGSAADAYLASMSRQRQPTEVRVMSYALNFRDNHGQKVHYRPDFGEYEKYDRSGFPSLLLQYRGEKLHLWPDYDKALSQRKSCDAPAEAGKKLLMGAGVTPGPRAVEVGAAAGSSEDCRRACEEALTECDRYTFSQNGKVCHFQTEPFTRPAKEVGGAAYQSGACEIVPRDVLVLTKSYLEKHKAVPGMPLRPGEGDGRGHLAAAAPGAACDLNALHGVPSVSGLHSPDVKAVITGNPTAAKLLALGREHQLLPPANVQLHPAPDGLLGGGAGDLKNDLSFGIGFQPASCVTADKTKAEQLAKEWAEERPGTSSALATIRPLQPGSKTQHELAEDATVTSFALELMRVSSCELAKQHEAAGSGGTSPAWVLTGSILRNLISAVLYTNGQLAGMKYLARKGIGVVAGEVVNHAELQKPVEAGLRPSISFTYGLTFSNPNCPPERRGRNWTFGSAISYAFTQSRDNGGSPPVLLVSDSIDATGLGDWMNNDRFNRQLPALMSTGFGEPGISLFKCEKVIDRANIRGVVFLTGGEGMREKLKAVILEAQEYAKRKYDLAVSSLEEFKKFTGGTGGLGQAPDYPWGGAGEVKASSILEWQKQYRIEKETLDCSPKPPPPEPEEADGPPDPANAAGSSASANATGVSAPPPPPPPPEPAADGPNANDTGGGGSTCYGHDKAQQGADADQSGGGTANQVQAASSSVAPPTPGAIGTDGAGAGESSSSGNVKVGVASYNILIDLQIPTNTAPFMKKKCESGGASHEQCIANAGSLISKYKEKGKPPIALLGEQEYMATGKAPFLKGLGADWKLLTDHITCAVWYNQALLPNAKAPAATTLGNRNDGPLVFLRGKDWDSDPEGVRCAVAGYFPDQRLLFGSLWCVHHDKVAGEKCVAAALSRFRKLADANEWKDYDRVIVAMDSNDEPGNLLGKSFPVRTPSGKDLSLRIGSSPLKTCCYADGPSLPYVGDYIADTAEQDSDPVIVPGAVADPVGLRSDHLPETRKKLKTPAKH